MQLAELDTRPRKPSFHLVSAEAILFAIKALLGTQSPKSAPARALVLQHLKSVLADARKSAEAELMATGKGTRCAMNLSAAEDELIRAIHLFATREVYPVDNPSGAEMVSTPGSRYVRTNRRVTAASVRSRSGHGSNP